MRHTYDNDPGSLAPFGNRTHASLVRLTKAFWEARRETHNSQSKNGNSGPDVCNLQDILLLLIGKAAHIRAGSLHSHCFAESM